MQKVILKERELPYEINEELKYLRTNIQFSGSDKKVILFTSSFASEGKSTTVLNTARAMTELGKRVLLIDADLRKSMLKTQLQDSKSFQYGLAHYLSDMATVEETICMTDNPRLYLFLAGHVPPNPSELLASSRMVKLLEWARSQFDYVFIDSAPLNAVIDAAVIAPQCDGAILVIEAERIPYRIVQNVTNQLRSSGCNIMGVVLNKVNKKAGRKYYSHYYQKYGFEDKISTPKTAGRFEKTKESKKGTATPPVNPQ